MAKKSTISALTLILILILSVASLAYAGGDDLQPIVEQISVLTAQQSETSGDNEDSQKKKDELVAEKKQLVASHQALVAESHAVGKKCKHRTFASEADFEAGKQECDAAQADYAKHNADYKSQKEALKTRMLARVSELKASINAFCASHATGSSDEAASQAQKICYDGALDKPPLIGVSTGTPIFRSAPKSAEQISKEQGAIPNPGPQTLKIHEPPSPTQSQ